MRRPPPSSPAWVAVARAVWESGQTVAATAAHVRKHPQSVERYKSRDRWTRTVQSKRGPKGPRPWHAAAKAPYEAGELLEVIGKRVGRSANTIGETAKRLGWERGRPAELSCGCGYAGPIEDFPRVRKVRANRYAPRMGTCRRCHRRRVNAYRARLRSARSVSPGAA